VADDFIAVYSDWDESSEPRRLGRLFSHRTSGREVFEFEFDIVALSDSRLLNPRLDPRLGLYAGRQYPAQGQELFGIFADASPDRWGRMLMRRRLEREQRAGYEDSRRRLHESDFLLGVHDSHRVGALRFRLNDDGPFLDNRHGTAEPPFVQLRAIEAASLALENDDQNTSPHADEWLRLLLAPGGSLGGARPKASVVDPQHALWIAKFPSIRDDHDVGAWEMIAHTLAGACGLTVPRALVRRFTGPHHTFLVERFDRTGSGSRLHFASAMTLTGHTDGDDAASGVSYLDIARVLMSEGAATDEDLRELWSRIVFNVMVSNTDDHLRNHGFLLKPGTGWKLSPAYDVNPVFGAHGLKLNISEYDNAMDLELVRSVAHFFRVSVEDANDIIGRQRAVVRQWRVLASRLGVPGREQAMMEGAFRAAA
jgi:serine/threonine-protein kinase HipA